VLGSQAVVQALHRHEESVRLLGASLRTPGDKEVLEIFSWIRDFQTPQVRIFTAGMKEPKIFDETAKAAEIAAAIDAAVCQVKGDKGE
jgi:hypothetical protein